MAILGNKFIDKSGTFDNKKFIELMKKAKIAASKKTPNKTFSFGKEIVLFKSVSRKELWQFINKLSNFINSGLDISTSLGIISKQVANPYLKFIILDMKTNINYGISISETMDQYPKVFDSLTSALISVGVKTGSLGFILKELEVKLIDEIELKSKVKGAMIYPIVVLSLTFAVVIFMMVFIVPKITKAFGDTGVPLPFMTQLMVNISNFISEKWYIMILAIVLIYLLFKIIRKTYRGEIIISNFLMSIPIVGHVIKMSNVVYFVNSFVILLKSGVLVLDALETTSRVVTDINYKREIIRMKNQVEIGLPISKAMGLNQEYEYVIYNNKCFSEEFAYVMSVGEEAGNIVESLEKIGNTYNNELKRYIGNLATLLEPFIIIIIGFMVGVIVISIMLPFFQMGKVIKKM
ncbi:MAG: type II secretion system F family protein [Candidatus Gracilibacteria bacterium]|nr:type II secretion system F family protein [Candidatus Gracilibacteria bacterium]